MPIELPPDVSAAISSRIADPDLRDVLTEAVGTIRMVIDKVLAHQADGSFALPSDPGSIERRLLARFERLPAATRTALGNEARGRLLATGRVARYGLAGSLDPRWEDAIIPAAGRLGVPAALRAAAERAVVRRRTSTVSDDAGVQRRAAGGSNGRRSSAVLPIEPDLVPNPGVGAPGPVPLELRLDVTRVDQVVRVRESGEVLERKQEVAVGAVVLGLVNGVFGPVDLGQFEEAAREMDTTVCTIPLRPDANQEQFFLVKTVLAEVDFGGFAEHLREQGDLAGDSIGDLLEGAIDRVACLLQENPAAVALGTLGGAVGVALAIALGLIPAAVGIALAAAVGLLVVGMVIKDLVGALKDDVYGPRVLAVGVRPDGSLTTSATPPRQSFRRRVGDEEARYDVDFRWEVGMGVGPPPPGPPLPPPSPPDELSPREADTALQERVDHVVVLMLEDRSFDHLLGYLTLKGRSDIEGLTGAETNPLHAFPEQDAPSEVVREVPVFPLADTAFLDDPPHDVGNVQRQIGLVTVRAEGDDGEPGEVVDVRLPDDLDDTMLGFADQFARSVFLRRRDELLEQGVAQDPAVSLARADALAAAGEVMGFHDATAVPAYDFIARHFAVCDHWFSSFGGNTFVNRTIAMTGRPARRPETGELITDNDMPSVQAGAETYSLFRELDASGVEWACYFQDTPTLPLIDGSYVDEAGRAMARVPLPPGAPRRFRRLDDFLGDAADGTLPAVSWIDPNFVDVGPGGTDCRRIGFTRTANDDHPPTDIAHGQALVASLLFALINSPNWARTLFVLTYDEHGGFHDHVTPGLVPVPPKRLASGFPADEVELDFKYLGPRVPALVVSPWVAAGQVSTDEFDHTSIIKTILQRFCGTASVNRLGPRVQAARHLGFTLRGVEPRFLLLSGGGRGRMPAALRDPLLAALGRRVQALAPRPAVRHELADQIAVARLALLEVTAPQVVGGGSARALV